MSTTDGTALGHRRLIQSVHSRTRPVLRRFALDTLSYIGASSGFREEALSTPRVHFLYTHSVPREEEDAFRRLLEELGRHHTFISYSEAVRLTRSGSAAKPYMCFSFDDAFASNIRTAGILEEFGTTGCFFVPTGFVGIQDIRDAKSYFRTERNVEDVAMNWDQIRSLRTSGHEIGSHTQSHPDCARLSPAELKDELEGSRITLEGHLDAPIEHFAWPFGRFKNFSAAAREAAFEAGYSTIASAERGSHSHQESLPTGNLCIRRDQFMTSWPLRHTMHFVAASGRRPLSGSSTWPDHLRSSDVDE